MRYKEVLSEKLEQLDYLYSVRNWLPARADILSEMIEICREAGVEVIGHDEWLKLHVKALTCSDPKAEAELRVALNVLKASLIKQCAENGLMRRVREVVVGGLQEEGEEGVESVEGL